MHPIALDPVQSVTITILLDNVFDGLLPSQGVVKRAGSKSPLRCEPGLSHGTAGAGRNLPCQSATSERSAIPPMNKVIAASTT